MRVPLKIILTIILLSFIISCGDIAEEQQKSTQKNIQHPSATDKKGELPTSKPEAPKPAQTPIFKEKKKSKKIDTLKPVVVIP